MLNFLALIALSDFDLVQQFGKYILYPIDKFIETQYHER